MVNSNVATEEFPQLLKFENVGEPAFSFQMSLGKKPEPSRMMVENPDAIPGDLPTLWIDAGISNPQNHYGTSGGHSAFAQAKLRQIYGWLRDQGFEPEFNYRFITPEQVPLRGDELKHGQNDDFRRYISAVIIRGDDEGRRLATLATSVQATLEGPSSSGHGTATHLNQQDMSVAL